MVPNHPLFASASRARAFAGSSCVFNPFLVFCRAGSVLSGRSRRDDVLTDAGPRSRVAALDTTVMAGRQSWPGELFRLDPAGATTLAAMAVLHITDIHADPFYNVSWYGCGNKGCTRNLTLQDTGQPTQNLCNASTELVAGECGPFAGSYEEISQRWSETVAPGPLCPCGVSYSDPPYSVMLPLRAALEEFANDGFAAQAAIYTGDLAGHYMPGASAKLEHRCCPCCLELC